MLKVGEKAPGFTLPDQDGNLISLSDFLGKKVVLYFYPKDNTPGCSRQAVAFKNTYEEFKSSDVIVIGISKDAQSSHKRFMEKYELPFILLSDTNIETIKKYDVWQEKKLYGKTSFGVVRSTYVIDEKGNIIKVFPKANPDKNAAEVLEYLSQIKLGSE